MKKITLLITFLVFFVTGGHAQSASSYGFANSTGTYTDNSGMATLLPLVKADDYISPAQDIGFNFVYEGVSYSQFKMSSNGFISFNMSGTGYLNGNDFSTANATARPIIAPLWDDLDGSATGNVSVASYELTGTAPNQVLTVEWKNWEWNYASTTPVISFQVKLYETTNVIEFIYRQEATAVASGSASIGIGSATGSGGGSYLNITNVATPAVSSGTSTTNINTKPATGQIFRFTPPVPCTGTPTGGTSAPALTNICVGTVPAAITVTGATTGVSGLTYQWEESTNGGGSWNNATGGTGATSVTYTPPAFAGTDLQYRLKITCTASGLFAYSTIANVQNAADPSTQASALNFTNTLYTNTTVNWTNGNGNRRIVIVSDIASITDPVSASGQPVNTANAVYAGSGQQIVYDGTGTSVSVSGLTCNSTYYFKVYEYMRCGSGPYDYYYNVTPGTNANSVHTLQPSTATLPVNNNFSGFTGANLDTVFPGWYEANIITASGSTPSNSSPGGGASAWGNSTVIGSGARINLYTNTRNEWIVGPKVNLTAASRLKFKAAITDYFAATADPVGMAGTDDKVDVLISTDACGSTWTVLHTFDATNTTTLTNALTDYVVNLSAYTGQTIQIAFRGSDGPVDDAPDYDFHIANIVMEVIPACSSPIALGANNITSSSASLFWTAGGTETLWNVQWGPSGFALGTGTIVNGAANPYPLSGLSSNTTYQYYVQSNCQANGTSTWAGPFSFTTLCGVTTVPYVQDFESVTPAALPVCTLAVNDGTGNVWDTASAPGSGFTTKTLRYVYNSANPANTWFFTQGINLTAGTSYRISYNYGNNSTTYTEKLKVAYGTSVTSASMTNVLANHSTINQNAIQFNQTDFTPSATGVYYFGFQAYSATDQYNLYVDNINITLTPACSAPINLTTSNVTHNAATISWGTVPSASGYQYVLDTNAADPAGSGTAITATTYNATPSSPSTTYYFHVRTDCSGTASAWSTISFTTLATPPANDNCANAMVLTAGGVFGDQDVSGTIYGATTTAGITPSCQASFAADVWYRVVVPASGNLTIETQGTAANSMTDSVVAAFTGTCGALNQVGCDDDAGAGNMSLLSLTGRTPGETLYIGVWKWQNVAPSQTSSEFIISVYDASLSSAHFDTASFKVYPNPVRDMLNLSYATEISSVEVYNMLGQRVLAKTLNVAQGQIDMSNLNAGNYIVKVTADGLTNTIKVIKQ